MVPVIDEIGGGAMYPEWDRLISRLRPNWSRVLERQAPAADDSAAAKAVEFQTPDARLRQQVRALAQKPANSLRADEGDVFDLGALVDWRIAKQMRQAGDTHVFRVASRQPTRAAGWLLIDRSASTAAPVEGTTNLLQAEVRAAAVAGSALDGAGMAWAIAAFDSNGRNAVAFDVLKSFEQAADSHLMHRLGTLRPGASTRLGAVLRHATRSLGSRSERVRWIVVFSDGEPHDVDVHDARYLVEDARQAVRSARRQGVKIVCIRFDAVGVVADRFAADRSVADAAAEAVRIFGRSGTLALGHHRHLPRVLQRLLR